MNILNQEYFNICNIKVLKGTCFDYVHRVGQAGLIGNTLNPCEVEYINELNQYIISLMSVFDD